MLHDLDRTQPTTHFAPAGRDAAVEFARRQAVLENAPLLRQALDSLPGMVMILNARRQIVASNAATRRTLQASAESLWTKRPGEAVGCVHSHDGPDGCGTDPHCATCGAVAAILESQQHDRQVVRECRVLVAQPEGPAPLDLRVTATPIVVEGERFVVVAMEDVSQAKRLAVLQRVFFHDVLNTASCLWGYAHCLEKGGHAGRDFNAHLLELSGQLIEEIKSQRDLLLAEAGDLEVRAAALGTRETLERLQSEYREHTVATGRTIALGDPWDGVISTDEQLLRRVLGNMLKNALEATAAGNTVTITCRDQGATVAFAVHNPEVMPRDVQLQVFQRSFSTKGQPGRGIGTYSMKLLGERYLGGTVSFTSQPTAGTTFVLTLPKGPAGRQP